MKKREELVTDFIGKPIGRYHRREVNDVEETEVTDFFGRKEGKSNENRGTTNFFGKNLSPDTLPAVLLPKPDVQGEIEVAKEKYEMFKSEIERRMQEYKEVTTIGHGIISNEEMVERQRLEHERRELEWQHELNSRKIEKMHRELDDLKRS